ncbi:gluconate transporter [Pedobacter yulinensis]|uniref:Gluconate transporter n=1 Tax=Pedobacter yulinensis TaxID=2126353 RepID=A0A2T3HMF1_9SPHI|nr:gluconate:H+ symporter [Pedobacter yulinensis]PST83606.1 gluconate transporter [Pedobacter yulinensis]
MTFLLIFLCLLALVLLISYVKIHPFIAFLVIAILAAILLGMPFDRITGAVEKGIGDMLSSLLILISFGAMFGKLVADSGAAQKIASVLMGMTGPKNIHWAMMVVGFIIGIPLFYGVGFVLMVPLIFSVVYKYRLSAVGVGIPMLAALSVTHGFLPPHPSPSALVVQFGADMGMTLLYGFAIAIPAIIIAGPIFSRSLLKIPSQPLAAFVAADRPDQELPGAFNSFFSALLPVFLLIATTLFPMVFAVGEKGLKILAFISSPSVVMMVSLFYAFCSLGLLRGNSLSQIIERSVGAVKDVMPVILIIAGSGALKQVFTESGVNAEIGAALQGLNMEPLVLGWLIAAIIRICVGSATVAGLTAAGIILPLIQSGQADPNLMVLSIGAGSLACSHVNDSGFWLFKEYFNLSMRDTFMSWSVMESIVAVAGLAGVLLLNLII